MVRRSLLTRAVGFGVIALALLAAGCANDSVDQTQEAPEYFVKKLGGETSAREFRGRPFNQSARSITNDEFRRFGKGAVFFDADYTSAMGLGSSFNDVSCLGCHIDEPQPGEPEGDEPGPGVLLRLSVPGETATGVPMMEPTYGLQLQTEATVGDPEGNLEVSWEFTEGEYPDGTPFELRSPEIEVTELSAGPFDPDTLVSLRVAPPLVGLGLLEAIPQNDLLALSDPDDSNGDGISGRLNSVWDIRSESVLDGRFGWKAGQPSVYQQSAVALHDDMGITSRDVLDPCAGQGTLCDDSKYPVPWTAELGDYEFDEMVFYNRTIAVPIARNTDSSDAISGANTFSEIGCSACHTPTQTSGADEVEGLSGVTFHPFTDLLLHDMGPGLSDGRPEFLATGSEWRTAPLWGFGRRAETTGYSTFLHDGRARDAEEAILWHGGEAEESKQLFMELPAERRDQLITFLNSL